MDLEDPTNHDPFGNLVITFFRDKGPENDGKVHKGFEIVNYAAHAQDFLDDKYKSQLVSSTDILMTVPSAPHPYRHEYDLHQAKAELLCGACDKTEMGNKKLTKKLRDEEKGPNGGVRQFILRFSEPVKLSRRCYADEDGHLKTSWVPHKGREFQHGGQARSRITDAIVNRVAIQMGNTEVEDSREQKGVDYLAAAVANGLTLD